MAEQEHPAWQLVEPAVKPAEEAWHGQFYCRPGEHEIELSKAISLKRIADALDEVVREGAAINTYVKEG